MGERVKMTASESNCCNRCRGLFPHNEQNWKETVWKSLRMLEKQLSSELGPPCCFLLCLRHCSLVKEPKGPDSGVNSEENQATPLSLGVWDLLKVAQPKNETFLAAVLSWVRNIVLHLINILFIVREASKGQHRGSFVLLKADLHCKCYYKQSLV